MWKTIYKDVDELLIKREAISKTRGNIPAGLDAVIEELFREPIIRWQDVLKNYIGRIPIPFKRTCTRLDRRQPHRLDIQGKLPDAFYKIVCVIDVSGSMSNENVAICLNEVLSIVSLQKKKFDITVIEFDVEISSIYHIKNKRDIKKIKRTGLSLFYYIIFFGYYFLFFLFYYIIYFVSYLFIRAWFGCS